MSNVIRQAGFSLIELMVCLGILGVLVGAGMPELSGYLANSKLRESASVVVAATNTARSEALRKNGSVSLNVAGTSLTILRESNNQTLWAGTVPNGVALTVQDTGGTAVAQKIIFNSQGQLTPFGTALVVAARMPSRACSDDLRCPAVLIEAGGAANVCSKGSALGVCL